MKKLLFFLLLICNSFVVSAQVPWSSKDVMLQGFYWDSQNDLGFGDTRWWTLNQQADEISDYFTLVWLPPSGESTGGLGYIPKQWCNQNSSLGSYEELKELIKNLKAGNTKVIADIVVNHRGGDMDWADFKSENFGEFGTFQLTNSHICLQDEWSGQKGGDDDGENYEAARDLCHSDSYVRETVIAYLKWMKNFMGYEGWRYDMVKGYHPSHIANYNDQSQPYISVGEFYDGSYDNCMWWLGETGNKSMMFDFPFKFVINDAFKSFDFSKLCWQAEGYNKPAGLIHSKNSRQLAVTFLDNHDTYARGNGQELCDSGDKARILQASALQLCAPGIPCVFYPHWQKYKEDIKPMIMARYNAGIHSNSEIDVTNCQTDLYAAIIHGDNGRLAVKIGTGWYEAPQGFSLVTSGQDYAIWSSYTNTPTGKPGGSGSDSGTSTEPAADGHQLIGTINSANWNAEMGVALTTTDNKIYTATNVKFDDAGDGYSWFCYTTGVYHSNWDNTWWDINTHRWGFMVNGTELAIGTETTMSTSANTETSCEYSMKCKAGTYNVSINTSTNTITLTSTGADKPQEDKPVVDMALVGNKVTLSVADVVNASIYYTMDGTTPSNISTKYVGAIELPAADCTIKAIAYVGGVATDVVSETFKAEPITIYVDENDVWDGSALYLYYFDVEGGSASGTAATEWSPAIAMSDAGNGWYSYTFAPDITKVTAIIKNVKGDTSGNIDQTVDIGDVTETSYYQIQADKSEDWKRLVEPSTEDAYLADNPSSEDIIIYSDRVLESTYQAGGAKVIVKRGAVLTLKADNNYQLQTVIIENGAEINAEGAANLTVAQLEIIKNYKYVGDNSNAEWFSLGLPFEVNAGEDKVLKLDGDDYVAAVQGDDYVTFDYDGVKRAANGKGDNWVMYAADNGYLGELIQFAETGSYTYKFIATGNAAAAALTDGREGNRDFSDNPVTADDNGWNLVPAGKTYTTDYAIDGVGLVQAFNSNGTFIVGMLNDLKPGTVFAVKLTSDVNRSVGMSYYSEDAAVETYEFELINAAGEVLDRIYLFDGSDKEIYRIGDMSSLSKAATQMSIQANNNNYCAYSTLASETDKSYKVSLVNITEDCELVMRTEGSKSVTVDGIIAVANAPIGVADGEISITIGSQTTSVANAAAELMVYSVDNAIVLSGAKAGTEYSVTSISGILVATGVTELSETTIDITTGIYVVRVADEYHKVIVR